MTIRQVGIVGGGQMGGGVAEVMAKAVVQAVTHYNDPEILAEVSKGLGEAMPGLDVKSMPKEELLATRGW